MKISLDWLGDFVSWQNPDPNAVADRLTLSTAEIEDVAVQGELLRNCCVAKITTLGKHPNADKLSLVTVSTDRGDVKVVCGGSNLREGMLVAFAHVGATVKHGDEKMTLSTVKIRGEESNGMICAAEELGLESQFPPKPEDGGRPIIDLTPTGLKSGTDLGKALGMNDAVFDVNNTAITTRPDLWSHRGMARECIALGLGKAKPEPKRPALKFSKDALPFAFKTPAKSSIVRYLGCAIDLAGPGESPSWMKTRLEAVGIRPISLPVDITNYVMLEYGTPLHAFDRDDIQGTVSLRLTAKDETIKTLDGVDRKLPEGALVLSDDAGIFDLVSMMGGKRTSISDKTRHIFLQGPAPDAILIRKTIQATGHRTDAATIFEKSVPPVHMEAGFRRAVELFLELAPGAKISSKLEEWGDDGKAPSIKLPLDRVTSILGIELKTKDVVAILESLGCTVKTPAKGAAEVLTVTPPLHRLRDLQGPHDLVEEVARIHGFENIENVRPRGQLRPIPRETIEQRVSAILASEGFKQILPLSLVGPKLLRQAGIDPETATVIGNPLTEELSLLQPSTIPQLLDHARRSHLLAEGDLRTFHCAHVFPRGEAERSECGLLHLGTHDGLLNDPFLALIERVAHALKVLGHASTIEKDAAPVSSAHPGRSAVLKVGTVAVARVFDVKPSALAAFDLPHRASCATLDLTALGALTGAVIKAVPLPAHPAVTYDLTFKRVHNDAIGPLLAKLRGASPMLESVDVKDLYDGKGVEPGSYNATLRFTYRAADRTLTEQEAKAEHEKVLGAHGLLATA
jgi:phenylalanyl-tRNA synthetase beta chain